MTCIAAAVMLAILVGVGRPDAAAGRNPDGVGRTGGHGQLRDFVPVGVRYQPPPDVARRNAELEEMRRRHFNVVEVEDAGRRTLLFIDRLIAAAPYAGMPDPAAYAPAPIAAAGTAAEITLGAWTALARGARAIVFDDWAGLKRRPAALAAASAFAEAITRNAALYAELRPRDLPGGGGILGSDAPAPVFEARLLQSRDALLLVAAHRGRSPRRVTVRFPPDVPEAVWRNMFTGASVHFVAGPDGPSYSRTFAPGDVLVLLINTRVR
jgi:hypothetical protein